MQQTGSEPNKKSGGDRRPEAIRRSLVRTMTAVAVILAGVVTLAVAAGWMAVRAGRHQERAETAELKGKIQLWRSYLDQAGANRLTGQQGGRVNGMESVRKAVEGCRSAGGGTADDLLRLRDEAVALLALPDAGAETNVIPMAADHAAVAVDAAHGLFAVAAQDVRASDETVVLVRRISDGGEAARLKLNSLYEDKLILTSMSWRPAVAGHPDKSWLAAHFKNGEMAMWSLPGGELCLQEHVPHGGLMSGGPPAGAYSADGKYYGWFSANEGPLHVYDLNAGVRVSHKVKTGRSAFSFRPNTSEIAIGSGEGVKLHNLKTGEARGPWKMTAEVHSLTWSRSGRLLAAMTWNGGVGLWNMDGTADFSLGGHTGACRALQFSPDERVLMSSSVDGTTRWWDTGRGQALLKSQAGNGLAYTPDGTVIICENNDHAIASWPVLPSPVLHHLTIPGGRNWETWGFDLSPDGKWFVSLTRTGMEVWELDRPPLPAATFYTPQILGGAELVKKLMAGRAVSFTGLTFAPDGTLLIAADGMVLRRRIVRKGNGIVVLEPAEMPEVPLPKSVTARSMSVSGDGRRLFVELPDSRAGVADMAGVEPFVMLRGQQKMQFYYGPASTTGAGRMSISGDGRWVAFGYGMNQGLTVFDAMTGREREEVRETSGSLTLFSPDSSRLLVCRTRETALLRTSDWKQETVRYCPGQSHVSSGGAFSGDGKLLALAVKPQIVELCRGADLTNHTTLLPPVPQNIRGVRMSRDGGRVAVITGSNEVQYWDVAALRRELSVLGLDWNDNALPVPAAPVAGPGTVAAAALPLPDRSPWALAAGLAAATMAAAAAAVFLMKRHRGLINDYAEAEALVERQRADLDRANAELHHSEKMKSLGTLAAGMAHDFNNLLSVIRMSGKLIARESREQETIAEHTVTIENAVLQGKQVVRSILGYSRAGSDDGRSRDAAAVVDDAVVLLSTEFLSGITLTLDLKRDTPPVGVPADRIEQMLLNLIINASEAMGGRGRLAIFVHTATAAPADGFILAPRGPAPWVEISVRDNGPGVPPELVRRIFEPFFTTKNAGNQRGTGLGLSMVHTIAAEAGAGIALVSAPGQGAAFSIFLPPVRETPDAQPDLPA